MNRLSVFVFSMLTAFVSVWMILSVSNEACAAGTVSLEKLQNKLNSSAIVQAKFKQDKYLSKLKRSLQSNGTVLIVKDTGVIWSQNEPFLMDICITDESFKQIVEDNVTKLSAKDNPQVFNVTKILRQILSAKVQSDEYFNVAIDGDESNFVMTLIPRDEMLLKIFKSITIKGSNQIDSIELANENGDMTSITLYDYDYSQTKLTEKQKAYFEE